MGGMSLRHQPVASQIVASEVSETEMRSWSQ